MYVNHLLFYEPYFYVLGSRQGDGSPDGMRSPPPVPQVRCRSLVRSPPSPGLSLSGALNHSAKHRKGDN